MRYSDNTDFLRSAENVAFKLTVAKGRVILFVAYYITKNEKSENKFIMTLAFEVQLNIENVSHNRKIVITKQPKQSLIVELNSLFVLIN